MGPDEEIAAELEASAERTRARSGDPAAARALERAAHLTIDPEAQARRLVTAADALWHAGRGRHAEELFEEAVELTADPLLRAIQISQARDPAAGQNPVLRWRTRAFN